MGALVLISESGHSDIRMGRCLSSYLLFGLPALEANQPLGAVIKEVGDNRAMLLDAVSNLEGRAEIRIDPGQAWGSRVLVKGGARVWLAGTGNTRWRDLV